jgi:hypothetical protein
MALWALRFYRRDAVEMHCCASQHYIYNIKKTIRRTNGFPVFIDIVAVEMHCCASQHYIYNIKKTIRRTNGFPVFIDIVAVEMHSSASLQRTILYYLDNAALTWSAASWN